jgi:hypothetical protein
MRCFLSALILLLAPACLLAQTVTLKDVGIHGYYQEQLPSRVQVALGNDHAQPVSVQLEINIHREHKSAEPVGSSDTFSKSIVLPPGSHQILELPILIPQFNEVLDFEAHSSGSLLYSETRSLSQGASANLAPIICLSDDICRQVEEFLSATNPAEATKRHYTFLPLSDPPSSWWAYSVARGVVLAAPSSALTSTQRAALEGYLRQGGRLLVLQSFTGNDPFLSDYSKTSAIGKAQPVGFGKLYRFAALDDDLASFFKPSPDQSSSPDLSNLNPFLDQFNTASQARKLLALNFVFPTFSWLLWWLIAYILVVGLLNFTVLKWLDRREWGWFTVPIIAILFSVTLYFLSSSKRPKSLELDAISVYGMDELSPIAAERIAIRVSSPRHADLNLSLPSDIVWDGAEGNAAASLEDSAFSLTGRNFDLGPGWNVQVGPPLSVDLSLLQWSFRDLNFSTMHEFPGAVHRVDASHLLNQTGQSFRDAIYVDTHSVYSLGPVPAGSSVDLTAARRQSFSEAGLDKLNRNPFEVPRSRSASFSLIELVPAVLSQHSPRAAVFLGLSDQPSLNADLPGEQFVRRRDAITIVSFGAAQ